MRKVTRKDLLGPAEYERMRDEMRRRIIEVKKRRRISVGPNVSLVFENRDTILSQIQEMCRAEKISDAPKIQEEIDVYNAILPDDGQLGATLFVEVSSEAAIAPTLNRLVGLQEHVWLVVGGSRIKATFDPDQFAADKLAAVQYLKFPLDEDAQAALAQPGTAVALAIDHPSYRHQATLDDAARAELATDLT
jgi:hypothetical protein